MWELAANLRHRTRWRTNCAVGWMRSPRLNRGNPWTFGRPTISIGFLRIAPLVLRKNENAARDLAIFSQLLNVFQNYYHTNIVTFGNREVLRFHLFNSFLRLLYDGGINEYEDPDRPFPKGHVQVMTIHQAKGLEFPVVVVGNSSARHFLRPRRGSIAIWHLSHQAGALRAGKPHHPVRPHAPALRGLFPAPEAIGADRP
ncbi:MAG: 3'-5' exonuclease [Deltaproteobacteria bacterium]|nr:3'-5' exonuclease [Deltaproteobacteria bacterium]